MSNNVAVDMYKQLGYVVYRRVLEYYSGDPDEDAYGEGFWHLSFLLLLKNTQIKNRSTCGLDMSINFCGLKYEGPGGKRA